jgi:hypothetical protein
MTGGGVLVLRRSGRRVLVPVTVFSLLLAVSRTARPGCPGPGAVDPGDLSSNGGSGMHARGTTP